MIAGDEKDPLCRCQFGKPSGDLMNFPFQADLYQVAREDQLVRRLCANRRGQQIQGFAPILELPLACPRQIARQPLAADGAQVMAVERAQMWIGQVNQTHTRVAWIVGLSE